jgi:uncharacterized protein YjiS (DUF1127 family)
MSGFTDHMLTNYQALPRLTVAPSRHPTATARLLAQFKVWRRRMRERRALAELTDRDLLDIGATRADIQNELAKPFWRD